MGVAMLGAARKVMSMMRCSRNGPRRMMAAYVALATINVMCVTMPLSDVNPALLPTTLVAPRCRRPSDANTNDCCKFRYDVHVPDASLLRRSRAAPSASPEMRMAGYADVSPPCPSHHFSRFSPIQVKLHPSQHVISASTDGLVAVHDLSKDLADDDDNFTAALNVGTSVGARVVQAWWGAG